MGGGAVRQNEKAPVSARPEQSSGRTKVPPLGRSGGSAILEWLPVDKSALRIEVIVDRGVQRGKFLQTSHLPEAECRPFQSSDMSHSRVPAPPDLCGKYCLEPNPSKPHHPMGNVDVKMPDGSTTQLSLCRSQLAPDLWPSPSG